jgi:hypothetical protein
MTFFLIGQNEKIIHQIFLGSLAKSSLGLLVYVLGLAIVCFTKD